MKNQFIIFFGFTTFLIASCTKSVSVNDKVQAGPAGTIYYGGGAGSTLTAFDLSHSTVLWQVDQAYCWNISIPMFESDKVYCGNVYGMVAVNSKTGLILWKTDFGSFGYSQAAGFRPANQPVIGDSLIYLIGYKGPGDHAWLHALKKSTGDIAWEKDLSAGMGSVNWYYSTPVIAGNAIYAVAMSNSGKDRIFCLDKQTGNQIWLNTAYTGLDPYPVVNNNELFIGNYGSLLNLNCSDGSLKWAANIAPYSSDGFKPFFFSNNSAIAWLGHNYSTNNGPRTFLINMADGNNAGNFDQLYEFQGPSNSSILYSDYNGINAINPASKISNWKWASPFGKMKDSLAAYTANVNDSPPVSAIDGIYYHQSFYVPGDTTTFRNSIFIIDNYNGQLKEEIKLDKRLPLYKFSLVKDNIAYYP